MESPVSFDSSPQANMLHFKTNLKPSSYLILHAHGGGFISQSSQSHEIYLKPWCKELRIPIVSIDYSLAPEYPYPRGTQECFYVYAWCLLNKSVLGWTGEKIICVGDSAGGVMVTNIVQQAIINKIRIPDALVPIYTPFLATYSMSPSRLLALMDPLLNLGILFRCVAAYCGFDVENNKQKFLNALNIADNQNTQMKKTMSTQPINPIKQTTLRYSKSEAVSIEADEHEVSTENGENLNTIINQSDEALDDKTKLYNAHLERMYKVMGDSIFLIEELKNHPAPHENLMSPLLSDDTILRQFPHTYLIVSYFTFFFY